MWFQNLKIQTKRMYFIKHAFCKKYKTKIKKLILREHLVDFSIFLME